MYKGNMLNSLEKIYDKIKDIYGPRHFAALLVLLLIISAAGFVIGMKYSKFIRQDPEYCNNCHLMEETYDDWRAGFHKTVTCQECHRLGVIEQNELLVKHVIYGTKDIPQKHGKKLPWESCGECHWEQKSQGMDKVEGQPEPKPQEAYGHYRHHFIECFNCHPFKKHDFPFDRDACARCHKDKSVHAAGMVGLSCVDCHIFSLREGTEKNRVIPTRQRCMNCHKESMFPADAPMAKLECFDCHDPHGAIKPSDEKCRGCHAKDLTGKIHAGSKAACGTCHKAHTWKTGGR
ncbi:MAG: NapC/NirT family cytochrome c [Nitrospirae bacterium]|nr:NapC/NirT family cytochrome c [Nitrospirota bacterium]